MKLVVLGGGPTGIAVIHELLLNGTRPCDITLIESSDTGSHPKKIPIPKSNSNSILGTVLRERQNKGLGKNGQNLSTEGSPIQSPSKNWGVSCFPPLGWAIGSEVFSSDEVKNSYSSVSVEWQIQAEDIPNKDFELSGEILGKLKRKQLSIDFVNRGFGYHSRLAITTSSTSVSIGCQLNSNCFEGCPNSAPWDPDRERLLLKNKYPEINICHQKIIGISINDQVVSGTKHNHKYDKLFLGIGAVQTRELLAPLFSKRIVLENSPVVIVPLITKKIAPDEDYSKSFLFTDLVVPVIRGNKVSNLLQIYLPTSEITGRVITQLPRFLHRLLAKEFLGVFEFVFRRIGIGMIFLESTSTKIDELDKNMVRAVIQQYRSLLQNSGIILLPFFKKFLLNGASYHLGAIHFEGEKLRGIDSQLFKNLAEHNVFITDTSALPFLPPGPYTSTAAALAKLIVKREM